jgi:hypothetical protein
MRQVQDLGTDPLARDNTEFVQRARGPGWEMPSNITKEDNQWHKIFRLSSQDEA